MIDMRKVHADLDVAEGIAARELEEPARGSALAAIARVRKELRNALPGTPLERAMACERRRAARTSER